MAHRSVTVRKKKRGPPAAAKGTLIGLRLEPGALARVDRWAASQQDDPSRSEAVRRLVELGLASAQRARARTKTAAKAVEMASEEIDRLGDLSATDAERRVRTRRLIRGPKEFQDRRRTRRTARECRQRRVSRCSGHRRMRRSRTARATRRNQRAIAIYAYGASVEVPDGAAISDRSDQG